MNKILSLLTIFFFLISCSQEIIEPTTQNTLGQEEISDAQKEFSSQFILDRGLDKPMYVTKNNIGPENRKVHPEFALKFNSIKKQYPDETDWMAAHELMLQHFETVEKIEAEYTIEIQGHALRLLNHYLLKVNMTENVSQATEYYMDKLMEHQGVDWGIMADAAYSLQNWVQPQKSENYKTYILAGAIDTKKTALQWLEAEKERLEKEGEGSMSEVDKLMSKSQALMNVSLIKSADYAIARLSLND